MSDTTDKVPRTYIEKGKKLEDAISTAWSFTLMGILGLTALLLLWTGLLPFEIPFFTLLISSLVLGALFLFFLLVGILAFLDKKRLCAEKSEEDAKIFQIRQWFQEHYSADAISNGMDEEDLSIEQLYFLRMENISRLLTEQFPKMEVSFAEYVQENIYQMYFPDEN